MRFCSLIFTIFIINILSVESNRAPDVSMDLPPDFCKVGKKTRTTGECICLSGLCEGSACQRGDLVFYSFADCPDCRCLPKQSQKERVHVASKLESTKEDEKENAEYSEKEKITPNILETERQHSAQEEAALDHELFMEDLYRYSGAGIVSIIFF